jgi:hypothetical protein
MTCLRRGIRGCNLTTVDGSRNSKARLSVRRIAIGVAKDQRGREHANAREQTQVQAGVGLPQAYFPASLSILPAAWPPSFRKCASRKCLSKAFCISFRLSSVFPVNTKVIFGQEEQDPLKRGSPLGPIAISNSGLLMVVGPPRHRIAQELGMARRKMRSGTRKVYMRQFGRSVGQPTYVEETCPCGTLYNFVGFEDCCEKQRPTSRG